MKFLYTIIPLTISLLLGYYYVGRSNALQGTAKTSIVCTTGMIADVVTQLVPQHAADIVCLMGPGVDPHTYKARAGDMQRLLTADFVFYNGLHLEGKMVDVFTQLPSSSKVVAVAEIIDPKELFVSDDGSAVYDPHVWHAVGLWKQVVTHLYHVLTEHRPEWKDICTQNYQKYLTQLDELDAFIHHEIASIPASSRRLVTAHDAFRYYGAFYGIEVVGLQGISTDAQIGIKDIQELVDYILKYQVRALFIESSIPHRTMQAVQEAVHAHGWNVIIGDELLSDALGYASQQADSYCGMLYYNTRAIVKGLTA